MIRRLKIPLSSLFCPVLEAQDTDELLVYAKLSLDALRISG